MDSPVSNHRASTAESGQILVVTAIMLPVLIGFMALVLDAGYAFDYRRRVQTAADAAALAGAFAVDSNPSISSADLGQIVRDDATRNGFSDGVGSVSVTVYWKGNPSPNGPSPSNGGFQYDYTADDSAVGVVISQPKATFLISALNSSFATLTMAAKAVANRGGGSNINIVVLHPSASDAANTDTGNANIDVTGTMTVNSLNALAAEAGCGSCSINATGGFFVTGGTSGNITPTPITGVPPLEDPFSYLQEPKPGITSGWSNTSRPPGCGDVVANTCSPGVYNNGIDLGVGTYTFQAGNYYINGYGLHFHHGAQVTGTGVTIYNKGTTASGADAFDIDQSATTVQLTAPSTASGPYGAIVYFQAIDNPNPLTVKQGSFQLNGVVYIPSGGIQFLSGGTSLGRAHSIIVAGTIRLHGGGLLLDNDFSGFGGSPLKRVCLAE